MKGKKKGGKREESEGREDGGNGGWKELMTTAILEEVGRTRQHTEEGRRRIFRSSCESCVNGEKKSQPKREEDASEPN